MTGMTIFSKWIGVIHKMDCSAEELAPYRNRINQLYDSFLVLVGEDS
jgi:hypothetical protein